MTSEKSSGKGVSKRKSPLTANRTPAVPTYWKKQNLIQFAAFKKHIGLYPGPAAVETFADRLQGYKTSKGTIQFPYDMPLPLDLISKIAAWCGKEYGEGAGELL